MPTVASRTQQRPSVQRATGRTLRRGTRNVVALLGAAANVAALTTGLTVLGPAPRALADPAAGPGAVSVTAVGAITAGTVPDGTCRVAISALGGGGASSGTNTTFGGLGASAARIAANFAVQPGQSYTGSVGGGGGANAGGVGGGGAPGTIVSGHRGGGGGGRTDFSVAGVPLVVAGGGGGGGAAHNASPTGNGGAAGFAVSPGVVAPGSNGNNGFDNPSTIVVLGGQGGQSAAGGIGGDNNNSTTVDGFPGGGIAAGGTGGNGGADADFDSAGGGGAGYTGGGGGASTVYSTVTGAGGGGGSSFVRATSPVATASAPTGVGGTAGPVTAGGVVAGTNGSLTADWIPCVYNLALTKTVSATPVLAGNTVVWTVRVTNNGPDPMTKGDTLDLTDTLPAGPNGPAVPAYKVLTVGVSGGSNSEMASGAFTCSGVSVGGTMPGSTNCSRAYDASGALGAPSGGLRGLNVGETLEITYEQQISASATCGSTITNVATVKDRPSSSGTTDIVGTVVTDTASTPLTINCRPPALRLVKALSAARHSNTDQFTMSISPSGGAPSGGSVTTAGTGSSVTAGTGVAEVASGSAGVTYNFSETMAAGSASALSQYAGTATCTNARTVSTTPLPAAGSAAPFAITPATGDDITCTLTNAPLPSTLTITKSSSTASYSTVGASVAYSFVVKNTGSTTLNSITITDPQATGISCPVSSLAPGTSTTCTGSHTVTQADVDSGNVVNTASVTGTPPGGSPIPSTSSNTVTVSAAQTSALTITKSSSTTNYSTVGASISYSFVVKNTGNVTMTAIAVTDAKTSGVSCPVTTLAPGASTTCTGTRTVTQADLNAGSVANTATVVGTPPSGTPISPVSSNTVTVPAVQSPSLSITKATSTPNFSTVGQLVSYTFTVVNTGNVTLSALTVTDAKTSGVTCPATTLAPGASTTCTGTHTVTQSDLDSGSVVNTAGAVATPPSGTPMASTPSNTVTVPAVQSPAMSIVKSSASTSYATVGATVPYSFTVKNTGNVNLTSVSVSDPKTTGVTCLATTLAPNATTTCTGSHTVTQADLDAGSLTNTATVVGTPPSGTPLTPIPSNAVTIPAAQTPAMTITKSTTSTAYSAVGATIPYSFTVKNTGNVTLSSITVADAKTAGVTCVATTLAPGASTTCTGTHTVTQADLDTGNVVNTATLNATTPSGAAVPPVSSNTVTVPATQNPTLTITKSTTATSYAAVGATLPYSFTVKNTGNVTLTSVSVNDPKTSGVTCAATTLAPGASTTCTGAHTVTQADLNTGQVANTATVVGTPPSGTPTTPVSSNTVTVPAVQSPAVTITKSTSATSYSTLGASVPYSFTVTNTGNVTVTSVTVTDPKTTGVTCSATVLAPGASTTCTGAHTVTQADLDGGSIVNTASVVVTPPSGTPLTPVSSNTVTVDAAANPSLSIAKSTTTTDYDAVGDTVSYSFTVKNTGNVTMTGIAVSDIKTAGVTCLATTLAPGISTTCTGTHTVTQADLNAGQVVNTASVVGTPPSGGAIAPVPSNTITVPAVQTPGLTVAKATTTTNYSAAGTTIPYSFTVTNSGNVTMTAIAVSDPKTSGVSCPVSVLAPGASTTCSGTRVTTAADVASGSIVNTATVVGTPPSGTPIAPASSNTVTTPLNPLPSLTIAKSTTATSFTAVGASLPYSFTVTNTGNVALRALTVTDANTTGVTCAATSLAIGASTTCTGAHTVTQSDLDAGSVVNTASAVATPPSGTPLTPVPSNAVTVPAVQGPALTITKSTTSTSYSTVGASIPYSFTVKNTGNVTMTSITVTDPKTTGVTCVATSLAPSVSTTCSGTHTVTQADLDAGSIVNTAKVVGTPPSGTPIAPISSNTITVPATQNPALTVTKATATASVAAVGQTIPYTFVVANPGNVTMTLISVTDANTGGVSCPATTLAPGSSTTCTGTHSVTQADLDAGSIVNTATVVGTPPSGTPIAPLPSNTVTVPVVQSASLTITKSTLSASYGAVGETVSYSFVVKNTGNVTLTALAVSDAQVPGITCPVTTLAPGASTTCTGTHTVVQADLDAGSVVNTASAVATPPSGTPLAPTGSNTVTVPAIQNPALSIVKSTSTLDYAAVNDVIEYSFVVTNNGNVTLTAVSVTDPKTTAMSCPSTTLAPAASMTCTASHTVTQADLDAGSYANTATVNASSPSGPVGPTSSNTVSVPAVQTVAMTITKSTTTVSFSTVGAAIPYSFIVKNTGNVTMSSVSVTDPQTAGVTCLVLTLAPSASTTCSGTHTTTQGDLDAGSIVNTASLNAKTPSGASIAPLASNTVTVPAVQGPALTVTKSTTRTDYDAVGQTVPYSFVVKNTGNVTLVAVKVTDLNTTAVTCPVTTLAPGASTTCTATHTTTQADLDAGSLVNTATATATPPSGTPLPPTSSNTITVPATQGPALTITKATTATTYTTLGDTIPYTFTVTNTGNVTITNITINDPNTTTPTCPTTTLAPDATTTCTATHTITQTDLDNGTLTNTATVTGTPPNGTPLTPTPSNTTTTPATQTPTITITKATSTANYDSSGDTIAYSFEVTNTGNVTVSALTITDPIASGITCPVTTLAPGASTTCTGSRTTTATDVSNRSVVNTAQAIVTPPNGTPLAPVSSNTVTVRLDEKPSLTITKATTTTTFATLGQSVPFTFTVVNTGNVAFTALAVTDPNVTGITCASTSLSIGGTVLCSGTHIVTQADLDAGSIVNTATAVATPPSGTPISPVLSNTVTVPATQGPALTVVKSTTIGSYATVGLSIPFTFEVTNTGNVTMTAIAVSDPNASAITCPATTLAPNASTTCTGTHTVTQADLDAGSVINTASVVGTPPSGTPITPVPSNAVTVPAAQGPALSIAKSTTATTFSAVGDVLPFSFTVTNTGNVTMSAVTVSDPKTAGVTCQATTLAPTASTTCSGAHTVTQADLDAGSVVNTATVRGKTPAGTLIAPTNSNTVTVNATQAPSLVIVKSTSTASYTAVGDVINYSFKVTNDGNVTVSALSISDPKATSITCPVTALAPDASVTCTAIHTVTQADLDSGTVSNTASVTATPPSGVPMTPTSSNTVDVDAVQTPRVSVAKSTTTDSYSSVGQVIPYRFVVTNTGNVTVTAPTVSDPIAAPITCPTGAVAPGASVTCTGSHTITQADLDSGAILNTAKASATPPSGTPLPAVTSNTVTVPAVQAAGLTIVKATTATSYAALTDVLAFTFDVTNVGNVTITGVTVTDPQATGISCPVTTLAPGASTRCTGSHPVTQTDIDNGAVLNTATVSGTAPDASPVLPVASNTVKVPAVQTPSHTIAKSSTSTSYAAVGDLVDYAFLVTNTGNVTLTQMNVVDANVDAISCPSATLAPSATLTCTGTHEVTQADLDGGSVVNTASVSATAPNGQATTPSGSNTVTIPAAVNPRLGVVKSTPSTSFTRVNEAITYSFAVTNTGNVTLHDVTVTDPKVTGISCGLSTLAPGASTTCTGLHLVTQADIDAGGIVNTASATAVAPDGTSSAPSPSNTVTLPATQTPAITIAKATATGSYAAVGDTVTYNFRVVNTGNVTLTGITISDPYVPSVTCLATSLAGGAATTCTGTHTVVLGDLNAGSIVNTARVVANGPGGALAPTPSNTVTVPAIQSPALTIVKSTASTTFSAVNDVIPYSFAVTNDGNVTVTQVTVTDSRTNGVTCVATTLDPAASTTCTGAHTVTQADLDAGFIANTAQVVANGPNDVQLGPIPSNTVTIEATLTPRLTMVKSEGGTVINAAGDTISYTAVVSNTGNVTMYLVRVDDPIAPNLSCPVTTLAPGASTTCTGSRIVTQADVDSGSVSNTAYVTGKPAVGVPIAPEPSNTVVVTIGPRPTLTVSKATSKTAYASIGEAIEYTFDVVNSGNVTMSAIAVSDPKVSGLSCVASTLAPGETTTCVGTHLVTQSDLDAGSIINTASVVGTPPSGTPIAAIPSNTVTVGATQKPSIALLKSTTVVSASLLGQSIPYTLTVTNTGNLTLTSIVVTDANVTGLTCPATTLLPGRSTTCTATHTVTQADLDSGVITNTAKVDATVPSGTPLPTVSSNTVDVPVVQGPALAIAKAAGVADYDAVGDVITYTFTVRNRGNVSIAAIKVTDPIAAPITCAAKSLVPGATTTCTGSRTVTQADLDAGSVVNTASVSGTPPTGPAVSAGSNTVTVEAVQLPSVSIVKASPVSTITTAGQVVDFSFTVTNTGNVTLASVTVTDAQVASVSCPATSLAPGASTVCTATRTVTQADVDSGSIVNRASVAAKGPDGIALPVVDSNIVTIPAAQNAALSITKRATSTTYAKVGDRVAFEMTVTNVGNVTLSALTVSDPTAGPVTCTVAVLAPGASTTCTAERAATQADLDAGEIRNTASVTAKQPDGTAVPAVSSNTVTVPADQRPVLSVAKYTSATSFFTFGQPIEYGFAVANYGNVTMTDVTVIDPLTGPVVCARTALAPGESTTCTATLVTTADQLRAGRIDNVATVKGRSKAGLSSAPTNSNVSTIRLARPDETTSSTPATSTPATAPTVPPTNAIPTLIPATSPATAPSAPAAPPSAGESAPAIRLDKTATRSFSAVGDTITYTFAISNTGNMLLDGIALSDTMPGLSAISCPVTYTGRLEVGASVTCTATYKVTASDLKAGRISNTANVSGRSVGTVVSVKGIDVARSEVTGPAGALPFTGAASTQLAAIAAALLVLGAAVVAGSRRRRSR